MKQTKRIYAMKVIKKELVMDEEDIDWVQTEKHVFEQASNHPFLVGLHSCFQTESRYSVQSNITNCVCVCCVCVVCVCVCVVCVCVYVCVVCVHACVCLCVCLCVCVHMCVC